MVCKEFSRGELSYGKSRKNAWWPGVGLALLPTCSAVAEVSRVAPNSQYSDAGKYHFIFQTRKGMWYLASETKYMNHWYLKPSLLFPHFLTKALTPFLTDPARLPSPSSTSVSCFDREDWAAVPSMANGWPPCMKFHTKHFHSTKCDPGSIWKFQLKITLTGFLARI